jgi:hypothetical protein
MSGAIAATALLGPDVAARQRAALKFTTFILFACLILQRFGLPFGGGKSFSVVGPIGLALAGWGVLTGTLAFDRNRLAAYVALVVLALAGVAWHAMHPGGPMGEVSMISLYQFLLLTAFATVTFAEPVEERRFCHEVNRWFAVVAVAGVLQFLLQFVGLRVFAFDGIFPASILFEFGYNSAIPTGIGDTLKSNGLFLVEPSVFSQVMALALIIEVLALRRMAFLALFITGFLMSFAGTGWIVLASFVAAAALALGWRGIAIAAGILVVATVVMAIVLTLAPDVGGALGARMDEISRPATSGHLRFITPFWALSDALLIEPSAAFIGLGGGISERMPLAYEYDVNTPIKIALEYGFPALVAYVALFVLGAKSIVQRAILVPVLVMCFVTGAYQQFPPVLFMVLLLVSVARLRTDPAPAPR